MHLSVCPQPVRVDDLPEVADFPRTQALLRARGLQSLLLFPLTSPGGPEGAIVLARTFGWAFAGAPLGQLQTLARMSGLCLERALALTALRRKIEFLGDGERDTRSTEERAASPAGVDAARAWSRPRPSWPPRGGALDGARTAPRGPGRAGYDRPRRRSGPGASRLAHDRVDWAGRNSRLDPDVTTP